MTNCYERYKHLDHLLSDRAWLPDHLVGDILFELWAEAKATATDPSTVVLTHGLSPLKHSPSPTTDNPPGSS